MDPVVIKLQEIVSHQGEEIARLSEELYAQQKDMAALRKQLDQLHAKLKAVADEGSGIRLPEEETPPPHY